MAGVTHLAKIRLMPMASTSAWLMVTLSSIACCLLLCDIVCCRLLISVPACLGLVPVAWGWGMPSAA